VDPSSQAQQINSIFFVDDKTGWLVGGRGTILVTTNGGETWRAQRSGTYGNLFGVHFVDTNRGLVVGENGIILVTSDGGKNWKEQDTVARVHLSSVYELYRSWGQLAWAVGNYGTVVATRDGGLTWSSQRGELRMRWNSVHFVNENIGWTVGSGGAISVTRDGGNSWSDQESSTPQNLFGVNFSDDADGLVVGTGGVILLTRDSGRTWQRQNGGVSQDLSSVQFVDRRRAWIVGDRGTILFTKDGGYTWEAQRSGTNLALWGVSFVDSDTGWVLAAGNVVLVTRDGGVHWRAQSLTSDAFKLDDVRLSQQIPSPQNSWWIILTVGGIGLFFAFVGAGVFVKYRRARMDLMMAKVTLSKERMRFSEGRPTTSQFPLEDERVGQTGFVPEIPDSLLEAAVENQVVLVLGAGASAQASLPTAQLFWLSVVDEVRDRLDDSTHSLLKEAFGNGDKAAIETLLAMAGRDPLIQAAKRILTVPPATRLPGLHQILRRGDWAGVIGLTWDELDLMTFGPRGFTVVRPEDSPNLAELLRSGKPMLIKPIGDTARPATISLTWQDYRQVLERWPDLVLGLTNLYSTRTLLFIGLSLDSIEQFLNGLPPRLSQHRKHYALVPSDRINAVWEAGIGRRFNIELIGMVPSSGYPEVPAFMQKLVDVTQQKRNLRGTVINVVRARAPEVRSLRLTNIGRFDTLEIDFPRNWTVLLGTNGCGKSTILKAIGLALCGIDPRADEAAQRMLRRGPSVKTGSIELTLGGEMIVVELIRERDQVRVHGPPITPVHARTILALGSPALRGVAMRPPSGYVAMVHQDPSTEDLLPLVRDPYDSRLDSFMQWALNAKIAADREPEGADAAMVQTLEKLIGALVPPHPVRFVIERRESGRLELHVDTGEATVPFESISQGMSSVFNWVGVLLQRLYDIFPNSSHPELEPALILIDEIDANLHPEWQRRLVELVKDHFPNVQVIATSHSPLVAGACERDEIRILRSGKASEPSEDFKGKNVQDVMMGSGFAMRSPRATPGEKIISRYLELFANPARNDSEEAEFRDLAEKFGELRYGTSMHEERIRRAVYQVLQQEGPEETSLDAETRLLIERELGSASVDSRGDPPGALPI
jgi:photosystem II stability/assembly factor-like uncharacterized protein/energy-coupling factor transporter ATP-binding protein EcfA2